MRVVAVVLGLAPAVPLGVGLPDPVATASAGAMMVTELLLAPGVLCRSLVLRAACRGRLGRTQGLTVGLL